MIKNSTSLFLSMESLMQPKRSLLSELTYSRRTLKTSGKKIQRTATPSQSELTTLLIGLLNSSSASYLITMSLVLRISKPATSQFQKAMIGEFRAQ